jgi:hypothetical protein
MHERSKVMKCGKREKGKGRKLRMRERKKGGRKEETPNWKD